MVWHLRGGSRKEVDWLWHEGRFRRPSLAGLSLTWT
jgi:hypothetical protein